MYKKVISLVFAFIFCLSGIVSAFAYETTTAAGTTSAVIKEESSSAETGESIAITDPSTEHIADETETTEEASSEADEPVTEAGQETTAYPEVSVTEENTTSPAEENSGNPYTTICVNGLSLNYTMKLKGEGGVYKLSLNKDNNWTTTFDGPEGEYEVSLTTESKSAKAGKMYNKDNEEIESVTIKRTAGYQLLEIKTSEHVTLAVGRILAEHWLLLSILIILSVMYIYLRKNRVLPSQER